MAARVEDVGEHVEGSRKDKWRNRALSLSDLADLSVREAESFVTKDLVWPQPDYAGLVAGGMDPAAAALLKIVRTSVAAGPRLDQRAPGTRETRPAAEARADYVRILGIAREELKDARTVDEVQAACRRIPHVAGWNRAGRPDESVRNLLLQAFRANDRHGPFHVSASDLTRARRMVSVDGFPGKLPAWRKGLRLLPNPNDGDKWLAVNKENRIVASGFASEDALLAHLEAAHAGKNAKRKEGPGQPPDRAHCEAIERHGLPDRRGGRQVSSQEFMESFGFKNVQFGDWVPHGERQWMIDSAYDALMDLAEVLGIEPVHIGLGGRLAAAFGARGGGHASAHYEPTKNIFNLTRKSGAGALAHEYGHVLDDVAGMIGRPGDGGLDYASGGRDRPRPKRGDLPGLGEAEAAFVEAMDALYLRPRTRADAVEGLRSLAAETRTEVERVRDMVRRHEERVAEGKHPEDKVWLRKCANYLADKDALALRLDARAEETARMAEDADFGTTETDFRREARLLSGEKGYNSRPTELFARAFEAAVFDALAERGGRCDYLVYGVEGDRYADKAMFVGNKYPAGEERTRIVAAMRRLVGALAGPIAEFASAPAAPVMGA